MSSTPQFITLERTLERTISVLTGQAPSVQNRALLIEARRLRSVIANWRSIPPPADVLEEMLERVLLLSTSGGTTGADAGATRVEATRLASADGEARGGGTEAADDFEPDLYLIEDSPTHPRTAPQPAPPPPSPPTKHSSPFKPPRPKGSAPPTTPPLATPPPPEPPPPAGGATPAAAKDNGVEKWDGVTQFGRLLVQASDVPRLAHSLFSDAPPAPVPSLPPPPIEHSATFSSSSDAPREGAQEHAGAVNYAITRTAVDARPVAMANPVNPLLVALADAYAPAADAYRALRRKLVSKGNPRVIAITSASPAEGKTLLTLNLALTVRGNTRGRVLVIEANLRSPGIGKFLGFEPPECFMEQVRSHADEPTRPWVVAEPLPKLHILAIDTRVPHVPILDPVGFSNAMDQLKNAEYDCILVDTPPVLGSGDVNVIADAVEGIILAAVHVKSKRSEIRRAAAQLEPAPILGVVLLEG